MTRKQVLQAAEKIICADREKQYGTPESNFSIIARLWSVYTGMEITPTDVAVMMALLKIARIKSGQSKDDNWIDAIGYMACGSELAGEELSDAV